MSDTGDVREGSYTGAAGTRRWRLYLPPAHDGGRALPLVVLLHGCTQDPADLAAGTRMDAVAAEAGVMVLYPEQPAAHNEKKCWNWYDPAHQRRDAGEPSLIAGMTRQIMAEYAVDPARVYVGGISAGGGMAVILAATYPDLYAAAAAHSGVAYGAARDVMSALVAMAGNAPDPRLQARAAFEAMGARARPVPLLVAHGEADPVVRAANTRQIVEQFLELARLAGAEARGAAEEERGEAGGYAYTRALHRDASGRVLVESWLVEGLGHAWSGGSPAGTFTDPKGPDISREMLRFFLEHRLPGSPAVPASGVRTP
ncbi:MAG TPA: PHB depolymerase family esterase [Longimicrobiales bacterium]|nr:PHB depolymerase family esterase [Longimicrobiales bacterium]